MASLDDSTKLSHNSMEDLIKSVMSGKNANIKKLSSLPQVKTRTKKLEEQERAKRQRKANASQKKEQASSSTTGAHSGENDGSKDGRRAERERRREEHRKNNPNYREKTPEEIAEIERKRRQRMAEESEKWNIGAEDAPPEGEPIDEDGYDDLDGGDDYGDEEDNDEEDDEEVMDLD